jgi:hypothetical protein
VERIVHRLGKDDPACRAEIVGFGVEADDLRRASGLAGDGLDADRDHRLHAAVDGRDDDLAVLGE